MLVVEDDTLISEYLSEALTEIGCEVAGVAHAGGEVAGVAERGGLIDVALVDLRLKGGSDGVAVARMLRERFDIPALILSGAIDPEAVDRVQPARPVGFLQKPVMTSHLEAALKDVPRRS